MLERLKKDAYLAPPGLVTVLSKELNKVSQTFGRLILAASNQPAYWSQNVWYEPKVTHIDSIGDAVQILRSIQRNWWPYAYRNFGRIRLIDEQLPHVSAKPLDYLAQIPSSPLGSFTLIDERTMLYAPHCRSPMPNGEWHFNEDRINPPSRAYLKLWELFTRIRAFPKKCETCIDLGASPGGWTWVLAQMAKRVIAYDRSPLDPRIMALKNVTFIKKDAFSVDLSLHPEITWIFSDVICFPEKLYQFIITLLSQFPDKKYVFTIKFRGFEHTKIVCQFAKLPGTLLHLSHNKHELTWFYLNDIV